MNKLAQRISDSELEVMRVIWKSEDAITITAIREALIERGDWEDSTIRTFVRRLTKKGVLAQEKRGVYHYTPLVSETEYNGYSTKQLIDKLYNGSSKNLIAALASHEKFTDEEIAEFRDMFHVSGCDE